MPSEDALCGLRVATPQEPLGMHLTAGLKLAMQPRMTPKPPISTFECWESRCMYLPSPPHLFAWYRRPWESRCAPHTHTHTCSHGAGDPGTPDVLSPPHTHTCSCGAGDPGIPGVSPPTHTPAHMVQEILGLEACPTPTPAEDQPGACSPSHAQSPRVSDGDPRAWVRALCG